MTVNRHRFGQLTKRTPCAFHADYTKVVIPKPYRKPASNINISFYNNMLTALSVDPTSGLDCKKISAKRQAQW